MAYNFANCGQYNVYQPRYSPIKIYPVSNIMEANATPVDNLEPLFFFNKAENVIYKKQIDGTGAAPIQIYKLQPTGEDLSGVKKESNINCYAEDFKTINERLDGLYELLNKSQDEIEDRRGKK